MRSGPGKFWLIARPVVGLGSGWNITTVRVLPVGSDVGRLVGRWCVMHRNLDTDTGSCRPRLFRSSSFCRHTLHIAVDCKHPADTKLKKLSETLYFGTIALDAQPTGHTFLPITLSWSFVGSVGAAQSNFFFRSSPLVLQRTSEAEQGIASPAVQGLSRGEKLLTCIRKET